MEMVTQAIDDKHSWKGTLIQSPASMSIATVVLTVSSRIDSACLLLAVAMVIGTFHTMLSDPEQSD